MLLLLPADNCKSFPFFLLTFLLHYISTTSLRCQTNIWKLDYCWFFSKFNFDAIHLFYFFSEETNHWFFIITCENVLRHPLEYLGWDKMSLCLTTFYHHWICLLCQLPELFQHCLFVRVLRKCLTVWFPCFLISSYSFRCTVAEGNAAIKDKPNCDCQIGSCCSSLFPLPLFGHCWEDIVPQFGRTMDAPWDILIAAGSGSLLCHVTAPCQIGFVCRSCATDWLCRWCECPRSHLGAGRVATHWLPSRLEQHTNASLDKCPSPVTEI